jgi:hypothetical protein
MPRRDLRVEGTVLRMGCVLASAERAPRADDHLSPRVPLHPVWQTPVARFPGIDPLGAHLDYFRFAEKAGFEGFLAHSKFLAQHQEFSLDRKTEQPLNGGLARSQAQIDQ